MGHFSATLRSRGGFFRPWLAAISAGIKIQEFDGICDNEAETGGTETGQMPSSLFGIRGVGSWASVLATRSGVYLNIYHKRQCSGNRWV